ncbi:MAG: ribosome silencing factor [Desulfovibrionaceae bacterium]|nr:ribosome silencing factor [Desulfovibrionaceae bacterium]
MTGEAIKTQTEMSAVDKALLVAGWLDEKQGLDIVVLDVSGLSSVTEALVLVTAKNVRQAQALANHVLDQTGRAGIEYLGMEGFRAGQWILMDLNDVVVHVFQKDLRLFYNIEGLWSEARAVGFKAKEGGG